MSITYVMGLMIVVCAVAAAVIFYQLELKPMNAAWDHAGKARSLQFRPAPWTTPTLTGTVEGVSVTMSTESRSFDGDHRATFTVVQASATDRVYLSVSAPGPFDELTQGITGSDVQIGDAATDAALQIRGRDVEVLTLMDAPTRTALLHWVRSGGQIRNGRVSRATLGRVADPQEVLRMIDEAVSLARSLAAPPDEVTALADRILDPTEIPGVRARALHAHLATHAVHAVDTCTHLLADPTLPPEFLTVMASARPARLMTAVERHLPRLFTSADHVLDAARLAHAYGLEIPREVLPQLVASGDPTLAALAAERAGGNLSLSADRQGGLSPIDP